MNNLIQSFKNTFAFVASKPYAREMVKRVEELNERLDWAEDNLDKANKKIKELEAKK